MKYLYNPPSIVKFIFNEFCWETVNGKILLTFDDGPNGQSTEQILKTLDNCNVKALFFCVGNNIKKYPGLTNSIIQHGHIIGNHTFNHKLITRFTGNDYINEIDDFNNLLNDSFGVEVNFFRPPHGRFNFRSMKMLRNSKMKTIMWNLLTYDYQNDFKKVKFAVDKFLKPNSIIVLHDSLKSKNIISDSIKYIYDEAAKHGYQFGGADECLN